MIRRLDRHLWRALFMRWLLLVGLGTLLLEMAFLTTHMGYYVGAIGAGRIWWVLAEVALALPEYAGRWLPLSVTLATLLTVGQLRREGALVALAAGGIAPARVLAPALVLGLAAGGIAFALADQLLPRLAGVREHVEARIAGTERGSNRAVSWREGDWRWNSTSALPAVGVYGDVLGVDYVQRRMVHIDRAEWTDAGWLFTEAAQLSFARGRVLMAEATPTQLGCTFGPDRARLAVRLRPNEAKTSHELLKAPVHWDVLSERWLWSLLPLLSLLLAVPGFVRHEGGGTASAWIAAGLRGLLPVLAAVVLGRVLDASSLDPVLVTGCVAGGMFAVGAGLWWRMRI